jgi:O-antigen/teichoic acid export membrane protein
LGQGFSFLINALLGLYLIYHMEPGEFGIYSIPSDLINLISLGILSLLTNPTQRFLAEYRGMGEREKISGLLFFSFMYFLIFGFVLFGVFIIFAENISSFFLKDPNYAYAIRLYSLGVPFLALSLYLASVLYGFGKFREVSISDILIPTISRAIFLLLLLPIYPSKVFVAVNSINIKYLVNFLGNLFASFGILKENLPGRRIYEFKAWFRYSFPIWLKYWLSLFQNSIKPVIVGASLGASSGGIFKASSLISSGVFILEVAISNVLFIEMSRDFGRFGTLNTALKLRGITYKVVLIMGVFSILSSILGIFALKILGRGYESGNIVLSVMILGYFLNSLSGIWQATLQSFGRSDMVFLISVSYAILDILLAIILIKPFGILGVALSFPISAVFITFLRLYLFKKVSGVNPLSLKTLIITLIFSALLVLVIYLTQSLA